MEVVEPGSSLEPAVAPVELLAPALVLGLVMSGHTTACTRDSEIQERDQSAHGRETQTQRASSAQRRLTHWRTDDHSSSANAFQARANRGRVGSARRDRPGARATPGVIRIDIARDLLDPDSFVATAVYDNGAAVERQESAPEVHAAMAMFPDALAAPPDRKFYDASRDPSLV
jgi:quinol monooxygenase YgiN